MRLPTLLPGTFLSIALTSSMFTGCHDHPIDTGPAPCRTQVLMAGLDDNFAPGSEEHATPSPEMLAYMQSVYHAPFLEHKFDQSSTNRPVGHTFQLPGVDADHPVKVTKAIFTMRVKGLGSALDNDFFHFIVDDGNGGITGAYAAGLPFLNGGSWGPGDEMVLTFDLGNLPAGQNAPGDQQNILDDMSSGRLHVYLQDDSAVDFMKLEVEYCSECGDDDPSRDEV